MSLTVNHDRAALHESIEWLEHLTLSEFRGRGDTVGAARARLARRIGLKVSYADRLWNKAKEMTGVAGGAYRALKQAYEDQSQCVQSQADHYRALREALRHEAPLEPRATALALDDVDPPHPGQPPAKPEGSASRR
ncbi:hypothetical protein [Aureimonas sp. Leaf454]|uniref:hypothetical protein n=1 Tax=Aureimonas sp. Leaf454 TaxID=1736381 RepID=UPI0012E38C42|nr:hypothetical protein [Aureimonas sp. Leaf454]